MNYLIPTIFLIAIIVISYTMYKEYIKSKQEKQLNAEERFIIEKIVMREIEERAEWWDNFNVEQYVKYLENK